MVRGMKRRDFLRSALALTGAATVTRWLPAATAPEGTTFDPADRVLLGPRRIECSRLFIGTGSNGWNHSSNQTRQLGVPGLSRLLEDAFHEGVTSWDSADQYGSHPHLARALADGVPREKVTILTKSRARTADQMRADIERFRRELGTDKIDILLLHCLVVTDWPRSFRGAMDVVDEYQQRGIIRSKGVSCHDINALRTAAAEPWVEINMARINPYGAVMDGPPDAVLPILRQMKDAGKGVIGMKVLGAGQLAGAIDECLAYALRLDCVNAITIGVESDAQRVDLTRRISRVPRA